MKVVLKSVTWISIVIVLMLTFSTALADTAEEIMFMDMKLGETSFLEAYTKLKNTGLSTVWWDQDIRLATPITCYNHSEEAADLGFPYLKCSESKSGIITMIDCNDKYNNNKYKVGGFDVTTIELEYSRYMYINGEIYYFDSTSDYRLYSGKYEFEYVGNSAAKNGKQTYDAFLSKLTTLYGEPKEFVLKADWLKNDDISEYHSIWKGGNNTGIILKCTPSLFTDAINKVVHPRRVVSITYGRTDMYNLINSVNSILEQKDGYDGL